MEINFLIDILLQDKPSESIKNNEEKIFKIIPELSISKGFQQNNVWHVYDVYEHILHVIDGVPNNIVLRMSALFHDIGKPFVYTEDENGVGHFYGHWDKSKEIFDNFATKYNLEENTKNMISNLILYHDLDIDKISDDESKNLINIFDRDGIIMLFQLKRSDLLAQNEQFHYLLSAYDKQKERMLLKPKGIIIAGFATCGKSFLGKKYSNVIDLESSNYKHNNTNIENVPVEARKGTKREINKEWPDNYYKAINKAVKIYDVVLVQLIPEHFDYFDKNNIKYSIAYPNINNWEDVKRKCINRGNNENFIKGLKNVFVPFYEDCLQRNYENLYIINENETLEKVLIENNIELKVDNKNE